MIWRKSTISNVYRPIYTRVTPTTQTLIEVLLSNKPDYFRPSGIINASLSDHFHDLWYYAQQNDKDEEAGTREDQASF